MIFCAKNEDGIPTWKLVLEGKKTITRRLKPMPIGKEFAIQPGRGKKAIIRAKVISCELTVDWWLDWVNENIGKLNYYKKKRQVLLMEARKEGFKSWQGLLDWFEKQDIDITMTYRIEFEIIKENNA